jgi:hypothetical protein
VKLTDEKARRLTWLIWRDRARRWLPIFAAVLFVMGAFAYVTELQIGRVDRTVDVKVHEGTVLAVKRGGARGASVVHVHLDDGRDVDALSALRLTPAAGAHVLINEGRHASGRLTFDVVRFSE